MSSQGYSCLLHRQNYEFYCQRCLQPICKQCTIIGPHHTQIHSITKLSIAYEKKVQQIRSRIEQIVQKNRDKIFKIIIQINADIQNIQLIKNSVNAQNNKQRQRMIMNLIKQYENNRNIIHSYQQALTQKSNQINDLGFQYQNLQNSIELLGSHQKILNQFKQLHDRVDILLIKDLPFNEYTKQLTQIRLKLKQVQSLKQLYAQKIKILQFIIKKTRKLQDDIPSIKIDYQSLLHDLNKNITGISHLVCHFCGIPFSFEQINNGCLKNNVNLNFGVTVASQGYCKVTPDTNKLGTHRHFFGPPRNPLQFYGSSCVGSFSIQLKSLLLKAKTLCKIRNINIGKQFRENDKASINCCQKIVFDYIFIQVLGMTDYQKQIIITIATLNEQNPSLISYNQIVEQLQKIDI